MRPERRSVLTVAAPFCGNTNRLRTAFAASDTNWSSTGVPLAVYLPFVLPVDYTVERLFWINGSVLAGDADIGLYDEGLAAIWRAGQTARAGASDPQYVTPASPIELVAGERYWLGFSCAGTSGAIYGFGPSTAHMTQMGALHRQNADQLPLPANLDLAWNYRAVVGSSRYPHAGFTNVASGSP